MKENKKINLPHLSPRNIITGDILFVNYTNSNLSTAIDTVTQTSKSTHFTHIGIAQQVANELSIYHSKPHFGVVQEPLLKFQDQASLIIAYRLKPGLHNTIPLAMQRAHRLLGQPYDDTFIHQNPGFYCSNYIQQIFGPDAIFPLEPMTFKNPKTGKFLKTWVEHYTRLGIPIPEGQPGCNPNGMAASPFITPIGYLY